MPTNNNQNLINIIIGINVIAFVLPYFGIASSEEILIWGAKDNSDILDGQYYRLFTSMFLHANLLHIFFNMYSLYIFGPIVLSFLRESRFMLVYFLSGLGGTLASFVFLDQDSIGASGAIFGLIGALVSIAMITKNQAMLKQLWYLIAINAVFGLVGSSYIDNFAHLGGFIVGLVLTFFMIRGSLQKMK